MQPDREINFRDWRKENRQKLRRCLECGFHPIIIVDDCLVSGEQYLMARLRCTYDECHIGYWEEGENKDEIIKKLTERWNTDPRWVDYKGRIKHADF